MRATAIAAVIAAAAAALAAPANGHASQTITDDDVPF